MLSLSIVGTADGRIGPSHVGDLSAPERRFLAALKDLRYGRFEHLKIENGQLVLEPWPVTIQEIKFATHENEAKAQNKVGLRSQLVEFFAYVRTIDVGEIRTLEVKHALPFSMEIQLAGWRTLATQEDSRD